jgi:hypothetical protein
MKFSYSKVRSMASIGADINTRVINKEGGGGGKEITRRKASAIFFFVYFNFLG